MILHRIFLGFHSGMEAHTITMVSRMTLLSSSCLHHQRAGIMRSSLKVDLINSVFYNPGFHRFFYPYAVYFNYYSRMRVEILLQNLYYLSTCLYEVLHSFLFHRFPFLFIVHLFTFISISHTFRAVFVENSSRFIVLVALRNLLRKKILNNIFVVNIK